MLRPTSVHGHSSTVTATATSSRLAQPSTHSHLAAPIGPPLFSTNSANSANANSANLNLNLNPHSAFSMSSSSASMLGPPPQATGPAASVTVTLADRDRDQFAGRSWEDLRKEARRLENEVDMKLVSYSKIGTSLLSYSRQQRGDPSQSSQPGSSASSSGASGSSSLHSGGISDLSSVSIGDGGGDSSSSAWLGAATSEHVCDSMAMDIEELLERLMKVNDAMSAFVSGRGAASAAPYIHTLQRHREILQDYTQEFRKTRTNISRYRDHIELLKSVRKDISEYKTSGLSSRADMLLRERNSLFETSKIADLVLSNAKAAREALGAQAGSFVGISNKLMTIAENFPGVNVIIARIRGKKSRDSMILGVVISVCLCIILYMIFF